MKKKDNTIVLVSRQAGTANAFVPLIRKFIETDFKIINFSFLHAHTKFIGEKIDSIMINSFDDALSLLKNRARPSLLLSGTSDYPNEDACFWNWAKGKKIPSIAFVDSWVFYWQRFSSDGRIKFDITPDFIAVIDDLMYSKMLEYGCDKNKLRVTGNPAFDELVKFRENEDENIKQAIKRQYGNDYILFVGEPFNSKVFGGEEKETLGYSEKEVLTLLLESINENGKKNNKKTGFIYKPHPRTDSGVTNVFNDNPWDYVNPTISELPPYNLAANAKIVFGMTSLLLLESSIMGIPVISIRPDSKLQSDIIEGHTAIKIVNNKNELVMEIEALLKKSNVKKELNNVEVDKIWKSSNFINFVNEILSGKLN